MIKIYFSVLLLGVALTFTSKASDKNVIQTKAVTKAKVDTSALLKGAGGSNCPASPLPIIIKQRDGSSLTVIGRGNRQNSHTETVDGFTILQNNGVFEYAKEQNGTLSSTGIRARDAAERNPSEISSLSKIAKNLTPPATVSLAPKVKNGSFTLAAEKAFPATGTRKTLLILIKFPDLANTYANSDFNNMMNEVGYKSSGSFRDFFKTTSLGQLDVSTDVFGWFTASQNYAYYGEQNGAVRAASLVREAIMAAEVAGVDFSKYDNDKDGNVDGIIIAHSGPGSEEGALKQYIWSHQANLSEINYHLQYDNVSISRYIINPEVRTATKSMVGIGVFCHEFGHCLGLPDLYDTNNLSEGVGNWCLMGGGGWLGEEHKPSNFSAWCKNYLGWIAPVVISSANEYSLSDASSTSACYRINTSIPSEYFLLENRQKVGLDVSLPTSGLAVWHINAAKTDILNVLNNTVNSNYLQRGVDLEEADGNNQLDYRANRGDAGDLFPGSTAKKQFDDFTYPSAKTNDGALTGVSLKNIRIDANGKVLFNFQNSKTTPATIKSFSPQVAKPRQSVQITGSNFLYVNAVKFGNTPAQSFYVSSDSLIYATVGFGSSGDITLISTGGEAKIAGFTYLPPPSAPVISAVQPESGAIGSLIKITGKNFSTVAAENKVYFGSVAGILSNATATELSVIVPAGADNKPLTLSVSSLQASAYFYKPFVVIFPDASIGLRKDSFTEKIDYSASIPTKSVATADFDGDGKTDVAIAYATSSSSINVALNTGDAQRPYNSSSSLSTRYIAIQIKAADFDSDGKIDLIASNSAGISLYKNVSTTGSLKFNEVQNAIIKPNINNFICADIDNDGRPDIIFSTDNEVSVARNTSYNLNIGFELPLGLSSIAKPATIYTSDFNLDGRTDLLFSFAESKALALYSNVSDSGTVKFKDRVDYLASDNNPKISLADMDEDKLIDIAILNPLSSIITFLKNTSSSGTTSFSVVSGSKSISASTNDILLSDFNGDTRPDLCLISSSTSALSLLKNEGAVGQIAFGNKNDYDVGTANGSIMALDWNGDGKLDLLTYNTSGNERFLLRNRMNEPVVYSAKMIREADYNVELKGVNFKAALSVSFGGKLYRAFSIVADTVLKVQLPENLKGELLVNNPYGNGKLAWISTVRVPVITSIAPLSAQAGAMITIKGDNFDIDASKIMVKFGSVRAVIKSVTYTAIEVYVPVSAMFEPISVTVNNLTAQSKQAFRLTFPGQASPLSEKTFEDKKDYIVSSLSYDNPEGAVACDFNADGKIDMAIPMDGYSIKIFKNTDFTFANPYLVLNDNFRSKAFVGDLDNDGLPDIVAPSSYGISIMRNTSKDSVISFASAHKIITGTLDDFVISDMDNDGKLDILALRSETNSFTIFTNTSVPGSLSFITNSPIGNTNIIYGFNVADINGDLLNDVILSTSAGITGLLNKGTFPTITFTSSLVYPDTNAGHRLLIADFDNDGKTDLLYNARSSATELKILKNKSTGSVLDFNTITKITFSQYLSRFCINDFDGDGKSDILVLTNLNFKYWQYIFKNNSTSTAIAFTQAAQFTNPSTPVNAVTADWDGDNKPDWGILNSSLNSLSIYRNRINEPLLYTYSVESDSQTPTVTLKGFNLTGTLSVSIDDKTVSSFKVVSDSVVTFQSTLGVYGKLILKTPFGQVFIDGLRSVTAPIISSFSPAIGVLGSTVVITGKNFNPVASENKVYFGTALATIKNATRNSITVTVPPGAIYGNLKVLSNGVYGLSKKNFTVSFPGSGRNLTDLSFSPKSKTTILSNLYFYSIVDLSGDGKPEVINLHSNNNLKIYQLNADSTFKELGYPLNLGGVLISKFEVGDMDGDGLNDLIVKSYSPDKILIYRNTTLNGVISFAEAAEVDNQGFGLTKIADLNGDGKLDLILVTSLYTSLEGTMFSQYVLTNTGQPGKIQFAKGKAFKSGSELSKCTVGDLNDDGKPEIITYGYDYQVFSLLRNKSQDSNVDFYDYIQLTCPKGLSDIAIHDINLDDRNDLIATSKDRDSVYVFLNKGSSTIQFDAPRKFKLGVKGGPFVITDLNGDGKPDVMAPNIDPGAIAFIEAKNPAMLEYSTQSRVVASFGIGYVNVLDFNFDGRPDILGLDVNQNPSLTLYTSEVPEPKLLSFMPIKNSSSYELSGYYLSGTTSITFGGKPAVSFSINSDNSITVLPPANAGTLVQLVTPFGTAKLDVVINKLKPIINSFYPLSAAASSEVQIKGANFSPVMSDNVVLFGIAKATVLSASDSILTVKVPVSASYAPIAVTVNYFTVHSAQSFTITFNNNNPSFPANALAPISYIAQTSNTASSLIAADFNNDGLPDMAATEGYNNNVSIFTNKGTGDVPFNTKASLELITASYPRLLNTADFNGDGKMDLVWVSGNSTSMSAYRNISANNLIAFEGRCDMMATGYLSDVLIADMDNDGKLDIVTASSDKGILSIYRNISSINQIQFAPASDFPARGLTFSITANDFNNDGFIDIASSPDYGTQAAVFLNSGLIGSNWLKNSYSFTMPEYNHRIQSGDIDGDGKPEVLIGSVSFISIYRNTSSAGNLSFASKVDLEVKSSPLPIKMADMNGDGKADIITVASGYSGTGNAAIYKNSSSIGDIRISKSIEYPGSSGTNFVVNDFTGDSRPDILLCSGSSSSINMIRNSTTNYPYVTSLGPDKACTPGSIITITGFNLDNAKSVWFDDYPASSFKIESPTTITAVTNIPEGKGGKMTVYVGDGFSTKYPYSSFTYVPKPFIQREAATIINGEYYGLSATYYGATPKYQWFKDGQPIANSNTNYYQVTQTGYYHVQVDSVICNVSNAVLVNVIPSLYASNFKVSSTAISCRGAANGKITITSVVESNFIATITKTGFSKVLPFTQLLTVGQLDAGQYSVCIAQAGKEANKFCYTIDIKDPKDLSLYAALNPATNSVDLLLDGATAYKINLNGEEININDSKVTLQLKSGENKIVISTENACQGSIAKTIMLNAEALVYPNPFDRQIKVAVPKQEAETAIVDLFSFDGKKLSSKTLKVSDGSLTLEYPELASGTYLLMVTNGTQVFSQKIIKR